MTVSAVAFLVCAQLIELTQHYIPSLSPWEWVEHEQSAICGLAK